MKTVELSHFTLQVAVHETDDASLPVAVAHITEELCKKLKRDPSEGIMALLVAAVYVAQRHSYISLTELTDHLADALSDAIVCAKDWYK